MICLSSLLTNPSNLIFPVNKGRFIVVIERINYLAEYAFQLADRFIYQPLSSYPNQSFNTEPSNFITTASEDAIFILLSPHTFTSFLNFRNLAILVAPLYPPSPLPYLSQCTSVFISN